MRYTRKRKKEGSVSGWICDTRALEFIANNLYIAEEAQSTVSGMSENAIHSKYIELVSPRVCYSFRHA